MNFFEYFNAAVEEDHDSMTYLGCGDTHENFAVLENKHIGSGRWTEYWRTVVHDADTDEFWAYEYEAPSTEMQEGVEFDYVGPYEVIPTEVVKTVYKKKL